MNVCMSECVLIFFFAQLRKKLNKQKKKRHNSSAEAFIFYRMIIVIVTFTVQDFIFFHVCFCYKKTFKHLREIERLGRKRRQGQTSFLAVPISPGEGFGAGLTLIGGWVVSVALFAAVPVACLGTEKSEPGIQSHSPSCL